MSILQHINVFITNLKLYNYFYYHFFCYYCRQALNIIIKLNKKIIKLGLNRRNAILMKKLTISFGAVTYIHTVDNLITLLNYLIYKHILCNTVIVILIVYFVMNSARVHSLLSLLSQVSLAQSVSRFSFNREFVSSILTRNYFFHK